MTDWRIEAGYTRFPEDNSVIGVPIDAVRTHLSQEQMDRQALAVMEMHESDGAIFAKQLGVFAIITVTMKRVE